jgi:signal peptidase I
VGDTPEPDSNPYRPPVDEGGQVDDGPAEVEKNIADAPSTTLPKVEPGGSKVFAFLVSIWQPGLGELYAGRVGLGVAWLGAYVVVAPIIVWAWVASERDLVWGAYLALLGNFGSRLLSGVIATKAAGRNGRRWLGWGPFVGIGAGVFLVGSIIGAGQREFVIESFKVPSGTMLPTVQEGDRLLVTHWHDEDHNPSYGDVVVYELPGSPETLFLKRVVGMPGDLVELEDNRVRISGAELARGDCPFTPLSLAGTQLRCVEEQGVNGRQYTVAYYGTAPREDMAIQLGADEYFVMGDNRDSSHDSRAHGPVRHEAIRGRVRAVWAGPGGGRDIE